MEEWPAPGPGLWELDRSHFVGGETALVQHIQQASMPAGTRRIFADLGTPADAIDCAIVNGFLYTRLRPLLGADRPPTRMPPRWVLRAVTRWHPQFRHRRAAAARAVRDQPWQAVVAEWNATGRRDAEATNLALQQIAVNDLDDPRAMAHVDGLVAHCVASWERHFWLHGHDLGPIGFFLSGCQRWGVDVEAAVSLLEGASPSTAEPMRILRRLREAIEQAAVKPRSLDDVRAIGPGAAADLDRYLEYRGAVLFSRYDIDGLTVGEVPDLLLATIMVVRDPDVGSGLEHRIELVRSRVAPQFLDEFDLRLRHARGAMNLRDDNGPTLAEWPLGLLRLALLEIGRRMVGRGLAAEPADALELHPDELVAATLTGAGPSAAELKRRRDHRQASRQLSPPRTLGRAEPVPPPNVLPQPMAELTDVVRLVIEQLGMGGHRERDGLRGYGVGDRVVTARAVLATSPEEAITRLRHGDVLVVACTTPAFNVVLPLAGAIVAAEGGPLSHAAVLARELDIPAVVGARDALLRIPDGATVQVNPGVGEVRVVGGM